MYKYYLVVLSSISSMVILSRCYFEVHLYEYITLLNLSLRFFFNLVIKFVFVVFHFYDELNIPYHYAIE